MKTHTFHANGMHCASCSVLIEEALEAVPEVSKTQASLKDRQVVVSGDFGDKTPEHIANDLSAVLRPHGYTLSVVKQRHAIAWNEFRVALPVAALLVAAFVAIQKTGMVNVLNTAEVGYGTAFLVGIVASVSTCMAVVGGLALSLSATFAKQGSGIVPQALFHAGRLIAFFALGGAIGALGAVFQLGRWGTVAVGIIIAAALILMGLNLLEVFPRLRGLQITLPQNFSKRIHGLKEARHAFLPFALGAVTFFLPCGFTQAMQMYTLTTGNFFTGALTMLSFALGTLPVLSLLSFGFAGLKNKSVQGILFKTAGFIVIAFGLLNLINSLALAGVVSPLQLF